jgi:hypothetical protein
MKNHITGVERPTRRTPRAIDFRSTSHSTPVPRIGALLILSKNCDPIPIFRWLLNEAFLKPVHKLVERKFIFHDVENHFFDVGIGTPFFKSVTAPVEKQGQHKQCRALVAIGESVVLCQ